MMLVFSSVPIPEAQAIDTANATTETTENPEKKAVEVVEERTDTEIVYDNQDGTFTKQIYTEPINVKEDGEWEPISNTMILDGRDSIASERTEIQPIFLPEMEQGKYSQFGEGNSKIEFSMESAEGEQGKETVKDVSATFKDNEVRYKDILKSTDLRNLTFNTSVKEDIVLHEYTGVHSYNFNVTTALKAEKLADGSIIFKNGAGVVEYTLPKPVMTDSNIHPDTGNATESDAISFELKNIAANIYQITLIADQTWLKDSARVYPVYIDPSVQLKTVVDAGIASVAPTTNYSGSKLWDAALNEYVLKVGRYDDTTGFNYAYIKPDTSSLANATIESATFKAYAVWHYSSTAKNPVKLEEVTGDWTTTGVTWNTRPTTFNVGSVDIGRNQWASFDVTSSVRAWTTGVRPNKGFMMHTVNQQDHWKKFTATETGKNVPYLEVTYTYDKPEKATIKTVSNGAGTGTGYMNISWDKVPGAIGYKVIIGNGYNYEQIPVGNVTSWTTKGKNIFPTQAEIASGLYKFHTDGKGTEFASDPRALYENGYKAGSTFGLRNQTKYIVRIVATYPGGDGPTSDITDAYMPPETLPAKPEKSVIKTFSSGAGTGTGYMDISWQAVPGAIDYKVVIGNGYNYEYFNTGNVTNWSTKGKKIFPTQEEIDNKQYKFHQDGKGAEFANDPRALYENGFQAGSTFGLRNQTKYIVRILAVYSWGDGQASDITDATMPVEQMAKPNVTSHKDEVTGKSYLDISWRLASGATSYKVGFFNGYNYQYYDVGNSTKWSTKEQPIWPTREEIDAGKYELHTDGLGGSLPLDPSKTYENAYTLKQEKNYGDRLYYYVRVIAVYNGEESPTSDATTVTMPMLDFEFSDVNTTSDNKETGIINLSWGEIEEAAGYKVWILDGDVYNSYDVSSSYSWSSKSKGIWPSKNEIDKKVKGLNKDGSGKELAISPQNVYQINNPNFQDTENYYTRITAYNTEGETIAFINNPKVNLENASKIVFNGESVDYLKIYEQAIEEDVIEPENITYEQFSKRCREELYPIYKDGLDQGAFETDIDYGDWIKANNYGQTPKADQEFEDVTLLLRAQWNGFYIKAGDIIITNGTSMSGIVGHVAIANSDNYILDMPGTSKKSKKDNNRQLTVNEWMKSYSGGSIRVYRLKNQTLAKNIAKYADRNYFSTKGTSNQDIHIPYAINHHLYEKPPKSSYCSRLVFQAYYYGSGSAAVMKPISGFLAPYHLIGKINKSYTPTGTTIDY